MQTLVERACGLDVHQATVVACLLILRKDGKVHKQMRTFTTTTRELVSLRTWLLAEGCTHVAMESTGVYWSRFTPSWREQWRSWWLTRNTSRRFRDGRQMSRTQNGWPTYSATGCCAPASFLPNLFANYVI